MSTIPIAQEIAAKRINDKDPVWFQLKRTDLNAKSSHDVARKSYEAAVREVAKPIAVERDELREALVNLIYDLAGEQHDFDEISKAFCPVVAARIQSARAIIAKYPQP